MAGYFNAQFFNKNHILSLILLQGFFLVLLGISAAEAAESWYPNERTVERGIRTGTTPSGAVYRVLLDKSGAISKGTEIWIVSCKVDPMSDEKTCEARDSWDNVAVRFGSSDRVEDICVVGHDFPGRIATLRVDKNKPVSTDEDGCIGGGYLPQMLSGKILKSRKFEWPYDRPDDNLMDTELSILKEVVAFEKYIRSI